MHSFKKVFVAVFGFIICIIIGSFVVVYPYFISQQYEYEDQAVRDALEGELDTIVSGASQANVAFIPKVYDEELGTCSYNLCGSRLTMRGRSALLQKEIARNPIKTVYLELSMDTLARSRIEEGPEGDIYVFPRMGSLKEAFSFAAKAFYPKEYLQVYADTLYRGFRTWAARLNGKGWRVNASNRGFYPRPSTDVSIPTGTYEKVERGYYFSEDLQKENEQLLFEIIEDCQAKGIEVIIFTAPLCDRVLTEYENFATIHQWYQNYADTYHCIYLDFNLYRQRDELFPDETAFGDSNHLSESGAAVFSLQLAKLKQKIDKGENVLPLFYDTYEQMTDAMEQAYAS